MLCATHPVLSATFKLNTRNSLKIRQTGQSPSDAQCPIMKSKPALFILLLDEKIMLPKQVTELLITLRNTECRSLMENTSKDAFLSSAEVLFDGLPNKDTIKSRIKDISVSARTVKRRIEEMAENISVKQTAGLQNAMIFSVALDESVYINDMAHSAVMAKYCDSNIREELSCLNPMTDTTKG